MVGQAFNNVKVEFIILTWNSEEYIKKCLDSVLSVKCKKVIHVYDNGSNDQTVRILKQFEEANNNIQVYYNDKNVGTTISRNHAMRNIAADCDYVCVLDSDTVVNNQAFEAMWLVVSKDPTIGMIAPNLVSPNGKEQINGRNLPTVVNKIMKAMPIESMQKRGFKMEIPDENERHDGVLDVGYLLSACWFMPASTIEKVGYLDENIFYAPEDVEYCVRVHRHGLRVIQYNRVQIVHDYQRISHKKTFSSINAKHLTGLLYYFKKYRYLFNPKKLY